MKERSTNSSSGKEIDEAEHVNKKQRTIPKEKDDEPKRSNSSTNNNDDDDKNNSEEEGSLLRLANYTITNLKQRKPLHVQGVSPEHDHPLPPFLPKQHWTQVGNALKRAEQLTVDAVPGECWVSLRCDGTGFGNMTKKWKRSGLLQSTSSASVAASDGNNNKNKKGYSQDFTNIMVACCRELMNKFNGKVGYTQSDELTVLIPPAPLGRKGEQRQPHLYGGRVQKLASLAASIATACFNNELRKLGLERNISVDIMGDLLTAYFDCRVGMYPTQPEAMTLILWRAYDCGVNGVSDAVHSCSGQIKGARAMTACALGDKLKWLKRHYQLPIAVHQREGTYLIRRRVKLEAVNQKTGEPVTCLRSRVEPIEGNVLTLCAKDEWLPKDETLEESNNQ
mmetsp:Transcript_7822/g.16252  ORF Transcript_7822/g.16252 Transcript_7822/m.16252 type:complete len:394 (-) Transcript_7822:1669-2850(-)